MLSLTISDTFYIVVLLRMQSYPRAFVILGADRMDCRLPEKIDFYVLYGKIKSISSFLDQCFCFIWVSVIIHGWCYYTFICLFPFGCSKFEPSALSLKRMFWDVNGVDVVKEGYPIFHKSRVHPI